MIMPKFRGKTQTRFEILVMMRAVEIFLAKRPKEEKRLLRRSLKGAKEMIRTASPEVKANDDLRWSIFCLALSIEVMLLTGDGAKELLNKAALATIAEYEPDMGGIATWMVIPESEEDEAANIKTLYPKQREALEQYLLAEAEGHTTNKEKFCWLKKQGFQVGTNLISWTRNSRAGREFTRQLQSTRKEQSD